jgi:arsenate reductase
MAEGWARHFHGDSLGVYSAGVKPTDLNPDAVRVMAESGIDISRQRSKHVDDLEDISFDYVVAVCDGAYESCPLFPGRAKVICHAFNDPPRLTEGAANEADRLAPYRRVRDEIRDFVRSLPSVLASEEQS